MKRMILLLGLLNTIACAQTNPPQLTAKFTGSDGGFAVCELFTSEGCSSCPPADALLKTLEKDYPANNVYVMEFHVDYWDKLGWKDKYSNPAYTKRQNAYCTALQSQTYTPQMIVNGKQQLIGSDKAKVHYAIDEALKKDQKSLSIEYNVIVRDEQADITFVSEGFDKKDILNVALVQSEDSSAVKAGENNGHTLRHVNIVRQFVSSPLKNTFGKLSIDIPGELKDKSLKLIVYTQNHKSLAVTSATALNLDKNAKQTSL
ncbi:DUF1223 domain-containing protein [Mucilaginibacter agri]|uniref:DUF1223 domain-containing protein n=1 Tax=Mucilaginibacter agri TaxID=2695265 RepID=A0A965ZKD1_9SPHI|nr:DUF1223 domain-containing protein [Mucilaginibacter agri]NCD72290.1 DUF1223 domain-containing protein [Mucilaginibacter agri]